MNGSSDLPMNVLVGAGCATVLLGSGLAFVMMKNKSKEQHPILIDQVVEESLDKTVSSVILRPLAIITDSTI